MHDLKMTNQTACHENAEPEIARLSFLGQIIGLLFTQQNLNSN